MHETGIALDILRSARLEMRRMPGGRESDRLVRVKVAIGELAAVDPELLSHAWRAVVVGGADADAELEIRWCPTWRYCAECAAEKGRAEGSWLPLCPDCGGPLQVEGGRELDLETVEFDHEAGATAPAAAAPLSNPSPRP